MSAIAAVNDRSFENEVVRSVGLVVVDFWSEGSQPCQLLAPVLDKVASDYTGKLKIVKCDIRQTAFVGQAYGVKSFPNLLFFRNGVLVKREIGYLNERQLSERINAELQEGPNLSPIRHGLSTK